MREPPRSSAMKLSFHRLATTTAVLFFVLALAWMIAPGKSLSLWGVEFNYAAGLVGRRGAALYAGVAVMFFSARHAEPSSVRSALVRGTAVSCLLLAVLGLYEISAGHATFGILPAVFIEIAFSLAFLCVDLAHPTHSNGIINSHESQCTLNLKEVPKT